MDKERLEELFDEEFIFENVPLTVKKKSKNKILKYMTSEKEVAITIPFILTGTQGIYVLIDDIDDAPQVYNILLNKFKLKNGLFVFAKNSEKSEEGEEIEGGTYYDDAMKSYVDFEDFYEGLTTFRANHYIPESLKHRVKFKTVEDYFEDHSDMFEVDEEDEDEDEDLYIRPLIGENKLNDIDLMIDEMGEEPVTNGKYVEYPDGTVKVKKYVSTGMMSGREMLFPCDETDQNKMFWVTVFGGWCGAHKFLQRKWGQGILYLLTCGMGGVFYVFDLINMLTGNYYYTVVDYDMGSNRQITKSVQKVYYKPLENKWLCALGIPLAICITIAMMLFVYKPVAAAFSTLLSTILNNNIVNNEEIIDGLSGLEGIENIGGLE